MGREGGGGGKDGGRGGNLPGENLPEHHFKKKYFNQVSNESVRIKNYNIRELSVSKDPDDKLWLCIFFIGPEKVPTT